MACRALFRVQSGAGACVLWRLSRASGRGHGPWGAKGFKAGSLLAMAGPCVGWPVGPAHSPLGMDKASEELRV